MRGTAARLPGLLKSGPETSVKIVGRHGYLLSLPRLLSISQQAIIRGAFDGCKIPMCDPLFAFKLADMIVHVAEADIDNGAIFR